MELSLDHDHDVYFTGQFVSGKIAFNLAQPISGELIIKFQVSGYVFIVTYFSRCRFANYMLGNRCDQAAHATSIPT